ncbi:MAG: AbrB/MazE/SpoVT family DNA-binding domain-containing protein [Burkholderiaceae bacterium]
MFVDKVRIPYFSQFAMLAKITSKNQLTLPKIVTEAVGATEYFDVEARAGQIILTPVRIQRGDAVRAKLDALGLGEADIADAVRWARSTAPEPVLASEPAAAYGTTRGRTTAKSKAKPRK